MAAVRVIFFQDVDKRVPVLEWMEGLQPRAIAKCLVRLSRLESMGQELRRPEADILEEGLYELRTRFVRTNLRMLYAFHGRGTVVVLHGFAKQQARVSGSDIEIALRRKRLFESNPAQFGQEWLA